MASPQLEDGFTQIANEILEEIVKIPLNGTQLRIVLVVWRYTYGFKRKSHEFSLTFFAQALDVHKNQIQREIKALIDRNILVVLSTRSNKSRVLAFGKNYDVWEGAKQLISGHSSNEAKQLISCHQNNVLDVKVTTNPLTKKERKKTLKKEEISIEPKLKFIDTVFLTQTEYDRLVNEFGKEKTDLYIEKVDEWQTNNPKKQKTDHNKTIRVWIRNDEAKQKTQAPSRPASKFDRDKEALQKMYEEDLREENGDNSVIRNNQIELF